MSYLKLSLRKKLFFSFIILVFLLLALELFSYITFNFMCLPMSSRLFGETSYMTPDRDIGWAPAPGVSHRTVRYPKGFDIMIHTGNGFRKDGQNIRRVKDCNIITIGDSHAFGFGLKEDQTLAYQLHSLLSTDQRKCLVFNGGVPGFGPCQYYLRLRSLGRLAPGSLVIVYFNPINDLSGLSRSIDYGNTKPYACLEGRRIKYIRPILYDAKSHFHFAPDFSSLNQAFSPSAPAAPPTSTLLFQNSQICQLIQGLRQKRFRLRWSQIEPTEDIGLYRDGGEQELIDLQYARRKCTEFMASQWSEILEFEPERGIAEEILFRIFSDMKKHVEKYQANLLIVISQEAYGNQGFCLRERKVLTEQLPQYTIQDGQARQVVRRAAQRADIPYLMVQYPADRMESMFIPYDGHTSAEGFSWTAHRIVEWMEERQFAFFDGKRQVKAAVQEDPNINKLDGNGYAPLHYAVQNGKHQAIERFINEGADVNAKDRWGETPLYIAASRGHKSIVETLLGKGADINAADHRGQTPLHQAVQSGQDEVAELLISSGADVNAKNNEGQTLIDVALQRSRKDIVELLMAKGALFQSIHAAAKMGNVTGVKSFLEKGANVNEKDKDGLSPLHLAVGCESKEVVELLLAEGADVNVKNQAGQAPLDIAFNQGNKEIIKLLLDNGGVVASLHQLVQLGDLARVKALLEQGADINAKDKQGKTALFYAVENNHKDIVELLIAKGADVNAKEDGGYTPLYYALWYENKDLTTLLISKGAEVNVEPEKDYPLIYYAVWNDDLDTVKLLVAKGAKFDVKVLNDRTAFHYAVEQNSRDIAEFLVSKGIDASTFHVAAGMGDLARVKSLIEEGVDVDTKDELGWTPLYWAASPGRTEVAKLLINKGADVRIAATDGGTALHQAAQAGDNELVELLLSKGADIQAKTKRGITPLHGAAGSGHREVAESLIAKGAEIDAKDRGGRTPLYRAVLSGHTALVELLLAKGADANVKDGRGRTLLSWAKQRGHTEIVELLRKHDAKE